MRRIRIVLAATVAVAVVAAIIWQIGSRYSAGPTMRHPPAANARADSSFFAQH